MEKLPPPFPFQLIRRRGQKKIRIHIDRAGQVVVSAPLFTDERTLMEALAGKTAWVNRHLSSHRQTVEKQDPLNRLAWQGLIYQVRQSTTRETKRPSLTFDEKSLICTFVTSGEDIENARIILANLLKKQARPLLATLLEKTAKRHGISYRQFQLRDQKTLWGSSSGRGCISLNWRIALLPEKLQNYLICHELCHQKVMNHSPAFWKELEQIFPGSRQANSDLRNWRYLMDLFR